MFRIVLHALWSRDFMTPLVHSLSESLGVDFTAAKELVDRIGAGQHPVLYIDRITVATDLMQNILQFGVYASVEQVGPVTETGMIAEFRDLMGDELGGWMVELDATERHVVQIVDAGSLARLAFESQEMMDALGETVLQRGAAVMNDATKEDLEQRTQTWRRMWEHRVRFYLERTGRRSRKKN